MIHHVKKIVCSTLLSTPDLEAKILIVQDKFDAPKIKDKCKCDTLLEFVKYTYQDTISKNQDLIFINDNQTALTNNHIPAMQMEFENKGDNTLGDTLIDVFIKGPNSFYGFLFSTDKNGQYSKYLNDFKNIINSIEFVSTNETKTKQPSFMVLNGKEEENQKEPLNQLQSTDQQQLQRPLSELTLYKDPKGRFTLEYDQSIWVAIPDRNRFDEIELTFGDKETGGHDAAITLGFFKDPMPTLSVKESVQLTLPGFIGNNKYEDKRIEEDVECEKMTIQGYDTCSFIFSQPKSYFESYPRSYSMMVNAKVGDEIWVATFTAPGDKFEELEQSVINMINSITTTAATSSSTSTITNKPTSTDTGKSMLAINDKLPVAKSSKVLQFSGNNYANMINTQGITPNDFTASIWFNSEMDVTDETVLVNKGVKHTGSDITGNNLNFGLYLTEDEQINGGFETSTGDVYMVTSPSSYNDGSWHQAVLTFNQLSHTLKLYIDGTLIATDITNTGVKPDISGNTPIRLGASTLSKNDNIVGGFIGELDDFTVWDVASTDTQILDLFNKESKFLR